ELRLIARDPDAWEDVWSAILLLDRDHHDRLRAILEACCEMSMEFIAGQGGLFQLLTADEMLESDVAATREDRRSAEGFVSPADARAFLELGRRPGDDARDPITRAYFRGLTKPEAARQRDERRAPTLISPSGHRAPLDEARELEALLRDAEVILPPSAGAPLLAALGAGDAEAGQPHLVAPLFERAMSDLRRRDPARFSDRLREVGYLVNVWMAGGTHEGRRPRPVEALEKVLLTCDAGMRALLGPSAASEEALTVLVQWSADVLFRRGLRGTDDDKSGLL
ncbi:MAG TPA: hypothetical protein VGP07_26395, partial [Polyangia bacterium]